MSDNQGNNGNNNTNGNGDNGSGTVLAVVALVVSVIALVGTGLQVVQQYLASAAGYSNCDATVIGPWHITKKRRFRLSEMRFQVLFETPVFFVCPADNDKGPIKGAPVCFVNGEPDSIKITRSLPLSDLDPSDGSQKQALRLAGNQNGAGANAARPAPALPGLAHVLHEKGVHTADNEMSTWVRLLQELQRMERDSQHWQKEQAQLNPPGPTCTFMEHKLCVALQAKKRSWDTMPASISRPYAASTICHLVEMAAMLGIYWKEFDRSAGRYRAEGNGYVLTGSHMADLGIVFTFQICGKSQFKENRIIPVDEAKEFAFGLVPTIFREKEDIRRLTFTTEDTRSLGLLMLGNRNELAETLVSIGCNTSSSNSLRDDAKKHGHLFPLAFEITGMLGRTLHIKTSLFRFLPNPTFYHWDRKYFSMRKLLQEYRSEISRLETDEPQIENLQMLANKIDGLLLRKPERGEVGRAKRAAEDAIDRPLMNVLHETLDACDVFLKDKGRQDVELVLREHVQELLCMVNNEGKYGTTGSADPGAASTKKPNPLHEGSHAVKSEAPLSFDDVMTAAPESRQKTLMRIYFARLRPRVVQLAEEAWLQQDDSHGQGDGGDGGYDGGDGGSGKDKTAGEPRNLEATSVWCTLVFRMLCWLLLHDFSKMDVQISKSELLGNRLPVYIW